MSHRLAWSVLPAIALTASAGAVAPSAQGNTSVIAFPAVSTGDRLMAISSTAMADDAATDDGGMPIVADMADAPAGDLGLAAAALANGPVATRAHRPASGASRAAITTRAKARLPEPATWLMLIGGMYGIGAALRRRHRASEAAFTARLRSIAAGEDSSETK